MKSMAYYNGAAGEPESLKIPLDDRSHWFGDGLYDTAVTNGETVFALDEHVERFYAGAEFLKLKLTLGAGEFKSLIHDLAERAGGGTLSVYFQATRSGGGLPRSHVFNDTDEPANLWVIVKPTERPDVNKTVKLITAPDTRHALCHIKTLNLLPNILAAEEAKRSGADEAAFVYQGFVTEGTHCNVHILKDGVLFTAPPGERVLAGVGREHLIKACAKLGVSVSQTPFSERQLKEADEVMITSASKLLCAAASCGGERVGGRGGEPFECIKREIQREYEDAR